MKKEFLYMVLCLLATVLIGCTPTSGSQVSKEKKNEEVKSEETVPIFKANDYSRISTSELIEKMGEPESIEEWTNKTLKGDFPLTTYTYDGEGIHYEFVVTEDAVVRATLYSSEWWSNEGEPFKYTNNDKSDIRFQFGISDLGDNAKAKDNNVNYRITQVSDKIARFEVIDIDGENKTFGLAKITYNLNYFDSE